MRILRRTALLCFAALAGLLLNDAAFAQKVYSQAPPKTECPG